MGTPQMRAKIFIPSITVNGVIVQVLNEPVGNLGAVFDLNMNMSAHVSKVIKSANYHLFKENFSILIQSRVSSSHW